MMQGYTLRVKIAEDLLKLYKAALGAQRNRISANDAKTQDFAGVTHEPYQMLRAVQAAAVTQEQAAYAAIGRFMFERLEELEAELEGIDRQIELRDQGEQPYEDEY